MFSGGFRWFPGWVSVQVEGGYPERLLNELTRAEIPVWRVTCREEWTRFHCLARDYRRLRPYARRACVRLRVRRKHGLPFWSFRYRHRKGLLVGLCLYALILSLLAPRIWVVQVVGNTQVPTEDILAVAAELGVAVGKPMAAVDIKRLELVGTDALSGLAFMTMNPSGGVARITVTEREAAPEILDLSQPSDIVAARDGRILRVEVRSGRRLVMDGEAVSAGTPLITGRIPSELGEKLYRAYGEVWAETRRQITVTVPLTYTRQVPTGEKVFRPVITFLGWKIPLYSDGPLQKAVCREEAHFLQANGLTLPLGVTSTYYYLTREEIATRTTQQAEVLAQQQLAAQEQSLFSGCVYEEQQRTGKVQEGQYILTVTYRCEENIALEVPLQPVADEKSEGDGK